VEPTIKAYPSMDWMEYMINDEWKKKIKRWKNERCGGW